MVAAHALPVAGSSTTPSSGAKVRACSTVSSAAGGGSRARQYAKIASAPSSGKSLACAAMWGLERRSASREPSSTTRKGRPTETTWGACTCITMSFGSSDRHAAATSGDTLVSRDKACGAHNSAPTTAPRSRSSFSGTRPADSSKTKIPCAAVAANRLSRASANAVPTFGCPAKGISVRGVKMRTLAVCEGLSGGRTNVVSE